MCKEQLSLNFERFNLTAFAQDLHDQEEAGQEDEAKQAHSLLDPNAHRQHH